MLKFIYNVNIYWLDTWLVGEVQLKAFVPLLLTVFLNSAAVVSMECSETNAMY